jgi:signal transduction histidine kinase/PAS domain-containing protein
MKGSHHTALPTPSRQAPRAAQPGSLPLRVLAVAASALVISEATVALVFLGPYDLPTWSTVLLHTLVSSLLIFPILYLFCFRPLFLLMAERARAEAAAEAERRRLFSLLDALPAIVYLKAPDYSIRFANRHFRTCFGDPAGQLCYHLLHGRDTPCESCSTTSVLQGQRSVQSERAFPDGTTYQLHDYPFVDVDGSELVLQLGIDITGRKEAEAELEQTNRELLALSQAERAQRLFAEGLAQATRAFTHALDLDQVLNSLLDHLPPVVPYDVATVSLLGPESQLVSWVARGFEVRGDAAATGTPSVSGRAIPGLQARLAAGQSLLISDTDDDLEWKVHLGARSVGSYMAVPLRVNGEVIGACELGKREPGFFSAQHLQWAQAVAGQAAVAVQRAWLFEEMRASREQLQSLSRRLVEVQEEERRTIARELHDEVGQALTSLGFGLKLLERKVDDPDTILAGTAALKKTVEEVMGNLHRLAMDLRPASLDHLGLVAALQQHCVAVGETNHLSVQVETVDWIGRTSVEAETALYRIVQEALTNVVRHAQASQVDVILEQRDGKLIAIVEDDGCGFDLGAVGRREQLGLLGMRERAEALGGGLIVESTPGGGTTVRVEVPYGDPDPGR